MEEMTYDKAAQELDEILNELKSDTVSIDNLAIKVERAAKLAAFCSQKLRSTEKQINEIIENLGLNNSAITTLLLSF